jgi:hypothetical protein
MTEIEKVVPELEWEPKRKYERDGKTITCYEVSDADISRVAPVLTYKFAPIFVLKMESDEHAKALMNDLYYGEYTGA